MPPHTGILEEREVECFIKGMNRHLQASTLDYKHSLLFVQRIFNANYSGRLRIFSSQMLFENMLNLDSGIFLKNPKRLVIQNALSLKVSQRIYANS